MSGEARLRVGQRVRHTTTDDGLGTVVEDSGDPEDRGAYLVQFDNGAAYQTSRGSLEVVPETPQSKQAGETRSKEITMLTMPTLETERLIIRDFVAEDLSAAYHLLDVELAEAEMGNSGEQGFEARRRWLDWTILNYEQLATLYQPPYGDRAIVLKEHGSLIGSCGFVPCMGPYAQVPALRERGATGPGFLTEFGLFWAISPLHQRRGYATESGRSLINYAFDTLGLGRIIATTTHDNAASIGVMRKLGMQVDRNEQPTPPWLQTVGVVTNPHAQG